MRARTIGTWLGTAVLAASAFAPGVGAATDPAGEAKFTASDGATGDGFGRSVAVSGDRIVVGSPFDDDRRPNSGSVYVLEPDGGGGWVETKLTASDGAYSDRFGSSVAVSGDRIVVGAPLDDDRGADSGSAYAFAPDGVGGWLETKLIAADGDRDDVFGLSVAVSGDRIVIGAREHDDLGRNSGSAFVFEPDGVGGWVETKLVPPDGRRDGWFGWSVAVFRDLVLVGAPNDDDRGPDSGSVYLNPGSGCAGLRVTISGTDDADVIVGTSGDDVIRAGPGDDVVEGGGDDVIGAGGGDDVVSGGAGNDTVFGQPGGDRIFGGHGDDDLRGEAGDDRVGGGDGHDRITGGAGIDQLLGGRGTTS